MDEVMQERMRMEYQKVKEAARYFPEEAAEWLMFQNFPYVVVDRIKAAVYVFVWSQTLQVPVMMFVKHDLTEKQIGRCAPNCGELSKV